MEVLMNNCHKFSNWFSEYMDGELAADKSLLLKNHLADCESCRVSFEGVTALRQNLKSLSRCKTSKSFEAVLQDRLRREQRHAPRHTFRSSFFETYWRLPAYAAAALLFIFLGAQLQKHAYVKQFNQLNSIAYALKNSAGEPGHLVVARIDTTNNRIRLINYVNLESAASSPAFYMTEKMLTDLRKSNLTDLRNASKVRGTGLGKYPSASIHPQLIPVSSQYQF
jgi:hypothetical protein